VWPIFIRDNIVCTRLVQERGYRFGAKSFDLVEFVVGSGPIVVGVLYCSFLMLSFDWVFN